MANGWIQVASAPVVFRNFLNPFNLIDKDSIELLLKSESLQYWITPLICSQFFKVFL
jgi:hypothetical protein